MPKDVTLIGFADDIAMVAVDRSEDWLMEKANLGPMRVLNWMDKNCLSLALEKTQAVLLTKRTKLKPVHFNLLGTRIVSGRSLKYLGVWLHSKLTFSIHGHRTIEKAEKTMSALSRLMPTITGPSESKRKTLACVMQSQILYAAPVWNNATNNKALTRKLTRVHRLMSIRVTRAYRTISAEAVEVIAAKPPIDLLINERANIYNGQD